MFYLYFSISYIYVYYISQDCYDNYALLLEEKIICLLLRAMRVQKDNLAMNKTELMNITCSTNYSIYTWDYFVSYFTKEHIFKLNYVIGITT